MTRAPNRIRSVLVIGDGIVGRAAAIALSRALPDATVALIQLPSDPHGWIDRLGAASTAIHKFHRQVGLDPRLFVQRTGAEPVHLRRYAQPNGKVVREACTATIPFVEGVPLHQIWLRHHANRSNSQLDFAAMLLALRDAHGDDGGFGARFDPAAYGALLDEMAAALGVVRHDSTDIQIVADAGAVQCVTTTAGARLDADLYVDAAGPRSRLLTALGVEWLDWMSWMPTMALTVAPQGGGEIGEESLTTAGDCIRWQTREWRAEIAPSTSSWPPGHFARSWKSNVVAIGEAAAHAPVVDGTLFGLAIEDILRIVALLPRPDGSDRDTREYNRRTAIAHGALADWSSLCLAPGSVNRSASLTETLTAFDTRGRVALRELDPIAPGQWLARMMALRPAPRRIDPTALALTDDIVRSTIARAAGPVDRKKGSLRGS